MELKPQHDLGHRMPRIFATSGAMAQLRVLYLEQLIVAAHRKHDQRMTHVCSTCKAQRALQQVARELEGKR